MLFLLICMLVWDFVHMSAGGRRWCYMWLWAAYLIWQLETEIGSCGRAARALSYHSRGHCQSLSWLSQKYFIPISIVYLSDLRILYLLLVLSLTKEWYLDSRNGSHKCFPIYSFAPLPLSTGLKHPKLDGNSHHDLLAHRTLTCLLQLTLLMTIRSSLWIS